MVGKKARTGRGCEGSVASLAFLGAIPLMIAIGAFSVDMMHYNAVQAEVQRACDAGALAGALELWRFNTDRNIPLDTARTVARMNDADGKPVAEITGAGVTPVYDPEPDTATNQSGRVRCSISRPYRNFFAGMFGNYSSAMTCTAVAGPVGVANVASYSALFPIAVAWGTPSNLDNQSLSQKHLGDPIFLEWSRNAAWTGFNVHDAKSVNSMIEGYMNPGFDCAGGKGASPPVAIGDSLNVCNGIQASNVQDVARFAHDIVFVPIVDETGGNPALVGAPLGPGSFRCLGFVGIEIDSVVVKGANSFISGHIRQSNFRGHFEQGKPTSTLPIDIQSQPVRILN